MTSEKKWHLWQFIWTGTKTFRVQKVPHFIHRSLLVPNTKPQWKKAWENGSTAGERLQAVDRWMERSWTSITKILSMYIAQHDVCSHAAQNMLLSKSWTRATARACPAFVTNKLTSKITFTTYCWTELSQLEAKSPTLYLFYQIVLQRQLFLQYEETSCANCWDLVNIIKGPQQFSQPFQTLWQPAKKNKLPPG